MSDIRPQHEASAPTDWLIDLTTAGPVALAAQLAVDELQAVLGGGPWCITVAGTGEVLAASGPLSAKPARIVPLAAAGLDLAAVECIDHGLDEQQVQATIERVGGLVAHVVEAENRAAAARRRADRAEARAATDALTGALDQGEWWRRIEETEARLRRHPRDVAIAVIDLDGLKAINDSSGHLEGDLVIRTAAKVLSDIVRAGDLVARVGGDEFAVLAMDHGSTADVLARRLSGALAAAGISASVGARVHRHGASLRTTYAGADRAMYEDKRRRTRE